MIELIVPILVNGSITALVALAYHVVIRATGGLADFAMGQCVVIGGLTTAFVLKQTDLPQWFIFVLGVAVPCLVAFAIERQIVRRLVAQNPDPTALAPVVATVSILWILEQLSRLVFGDFPLRGPAVLDGVAFRISDIVVTKHAIALIVVAALVFVGVSMFLRGTRAGRRLRAIGDNPLAADVLGFDVNRNRATAFLLAGLIAGIAGVLGSSLAGYRALGGGYYTLNGFVALYLGGVSRPAGALLGGLLLEALKIIVGRYAGSGFQDYVVLVVALVVFGLRPQGLLSPPRARRA